MVNDEGKQLVVRKVGVESEGVVVKGLTGERMCWR